jgi:hypothetical protein
MYLKNLSLFLIVNIVFVACHSQNNIVHENPSLKNGSDTTRLFLSYAIDTNTYLKQHKVINFVKKRSYEVQRLLDSVYFLTNQEINELASKKIVLLQNFLYEKNTVISFKYYLHTENQSNTEIEEHFNDFCTGFEADLSNKHPVDFVNKFTAAYCNIFFTLDSISVTSNFPSFNKEFEDYAKNNFMYYAPLDTAIKISNAQHYSLVNISSLNANDDKYKDILVYDLADEMIANSLTDFWIFSKEKNDFVHVKELTVPIWKIDTVHRIFFSGWHERVNQPNAYKFKIKGTKIKILKRYPNY